MSDQNDDRVTLSLLTGRKVRIAELSPANRAELFRTILREGGFERSPKTLSWSNSITRPTLVNDPFGAGRAVFESRGELGPAPSWLVILGSEHDRREGKSGLVMLCLGAWGEVWVAEQPQSSGNHDLWNSSIHRLDLGDELLELAALTQLLFWSLKNLRLIADWWVEEADKEMRAAGRRKKRVYELTDRVDLQP